MARARNLKPGFFKNDKLAECEPLARILFSGLWTLADRKGRLEFRPKRIKVEILPYDDCDIIELLNQLLQNDFIVIYEVDGEQYIEIPKFLEHQNPHIKEPESVIPCPDSETSVIIKDLFKHSKSTIQEQCNNSSSPAESLNPITESPVLNPESLKRVSGTRTVKKNAGKINYAEFVIMTEQEYKKLVDEHGEDRTKRMITILDNYKGANGKKYSSDYRAILNWVVKREDEENRANNSTGPPIGTPKPKGFDGIMAGLQMMSEGSGDL